AVSSTIQKVFRIDSHIGATYSGIMSDGIHIIDTARSITQSHRLIFNEVKSIDALARELSSYMMQATQYGGIRPYAVSILLGGVDSTPKLYEIDPGASYLGYKADAIGMGKKVAFDILSKEYKENMSTDDAIALGIKIIKKVSEKKLTEDSVDISYVEKGGEYTALSLKEIAKYL
ncbi:MAG: hypothetical protein QW530_01855, partial [Candidatus Micrarchaeaceae archaeon]